MADSSSPVSWPISHHFQFADYAVFGGMLLVSTVIGLYHGCKWCRRGKGKLEAGNDSPAEFLIANGKLGTVPVALSMLARYIFILF